MSWKFCKSKPAPVPAAAPKSMADIDWPTDLHRPARFLLGMLSQKTPPFSDWESTGCNLTEGAREAARTAVHRYQLACWFSMVGRDHGVVAAQMMSSPRLPLAGGLYVGGI